LDWPSQRPGRDDVWLENGVAYRETADGLATAITDVDGLKPLINRAGAAIVSGMRRARRSTLPTG